MKSLVWQMIQVPIGWLGLVGDDEALVRIISRPDEDQVLEHLELEYPGCQQGTTAILLQACRELNDYFAGRCQDFSTPLRFSDVHGFTRACLETLQQTPYGDVLSYGELAAAAGSPRAARAVGNAMAANPWPIIVPCHRVVAAGGKLGGYSGGAGPVTKNWLLQFEQKKLAETADLA
jgi:methylated-DNA-[protein]-cysteine S-methyltransferase